MAQTEVDKILAKDYEDESGTAEETALIGSVGDSPYAERIRADFQSAYFTAPDAAKQTP
ncbi:MAG: hypothetical protein IE886_06065 [Campylobacterales bacterium]|nr:hypothetical protein [Campylobacterales bacterium]